MEKMKECPFCGKSPELVYVWEWTSLHEGGYSWVVRCNYLKGGCGAKGPSSVDKKGALELWQKRFQKN